MNFPSVGSSSGTPEPPEDYYVAGMELLLAIRRNVGSNHGLSRVRRRAAKTVKDFVMIRKMDLYVFWYIQPIDFLFTLSLNIALGAYWTNTLLYNPFPRRRTIII